MSRHKEFAAPALLLAPAALFPAALWLSGKSPFWGDLTYLHHPWRALAAEMVQGGELPLWNPYAYLGMPLAAEMQCAVWYPGTIPFHLFSFAAGLALFHALHFGLAGFFCFLWLRKEGLAPAASFAGAAAFMGCGSLVSRAPFLNHLSTLAFLPAFLLLRGQAPLLGFAFALSFLSGYPLMMAGSAAVALVWPRLLGGAGAKLRTWLGAAFLSAGIAACLLLPAFELLIRSRRGAGLGLEDTLLFGLTPADWRQWISPWIVPSSDFSPSVFWWKTCYLGIFSWAAILFALRRMSPRALAGALVYLLAAGSLLLGGSTPVSRWLWAHLAALRYVRYPGNLAYLLLPAFSLMTAAGIHRRPWAPLFALGLVVELAGYAAVSQPVMPSRYFSDAGPLVRELQSSSERRYLLSPNALHRPRRARVLDWRRRLYGLTNLPFHLSSAANFGEPLVPAASYAYMDFIFSRGGLDDAAPYLAWSDVGVLLARDRLPSGRLRYDGRNLWHRYRVPGPLSRAHWFNERDGSKIAAELGGAGSLPNLEKAVPLSLERRREDRFVVRGRTDEGWVYLAEPLGAGWEARLDGREVSGTPALGPFQKFHVPAGAWELRLRYAPVSWRLGLALTCVFLIGAAAYWYNRLSIRIS